jgi:hypothetical protein
MLLSFFCFAQDKKTEKLKLFVDCSNTNCDMNFSKTEILFVDFVLDNPSADLHVLITEVDNGGGGDQYQLIFYGQRNYKAKTDTFEVCHITWCY